MPGANESNVGGGYPFWRQKHDFPPRLGGILIKSIAQLARSGVRQCATIGLLGAATLLLCQCRRQVSTETPTSRTTPAPTVIPTPSATVALTPSITPTPTPTPAPAASTSPIPLPTVSPTPDAFAEGMKQLLQASVKGFLDLRGKYKNTENGSGPVPLFRVRKIYQGTFLLGDAASAELEEVYYNTAGRQPAYNYHLYYQVLSARNSIEKYDQLRQNLNRVLRGFEHTFGDRYDAWARGDPLKTAVLLSSQDIAGSPEIQVHVAFSSPQW